MDFESLLEEGFSQERAKEILQKLEGEKSFDETHELFSNHNVSKKDIEEKNHHPFDAMDKKREKSMER